MPAHRGDGHAPLRLTTESLAYLLTGGFSSVVFNGVLGASLVLSTAAAWIITALETRYWEQNWDKLPEYADPPPWR